MFASGSRVATLGIGMPCGITPPSSSCIPPSQYKSQAVCCRERLRVIVFDETAILSSERVLICTNTLCFDEVSKYFCMELEFLPHFDCRPSGSTVCPF